MAEITLPVREEVTCLVDVMLLGRRYIAIGTAIHSEEDEDDIDEAHTRAKEGRVMLVSPDFDQPPARWTINTECEIKTVGAVRDITTVHGFLAVAAASKVSIHRYETGKDLVEVSSFASTFIAQSLCTSPPSRQKTEETLIVGDGMRSILILDVDEESGKIWGDDRDMATHQVSTLSNIYDQGPGVVVADVRHLSSGSKVRYMTDYLVGLLECPDVPSKRPDRTSSHIRSTRRSDPLPIRFIRPSDDRIRGDLPRSGLRNLRRSIRDDWGIIRLCRQSFR